MTNTQNQKPGDEKTDVNGILANRKIENKFTTARAQETFFNKIQSKQSSITLDEIERFEAILAKTRNEEEISDADKEFAANIQPKYTDYVVDTRRYQEYAYLKALNEMQVPLDETDAKRFEELNAMYGQLESQEIDTSFPSKAHIGEFKDSEIEEMKKLFAVGLKKLGDDDAKRLHELMDTYPAEARQMSETAEMKDLISKMDSGNALTADEAGRFADLSKIYSNGQAQESEELSNAKDLAELKMLIEAGPDDLDTEQGGRYLYLSNTYPVESKQMTQDAEKTEFLAMLENGTEGLTIPEMNRLNELIGNYPQVYEDFLNSQYEPQVNVTGINNGTTATDESSSTDIIAVNNTAAPEYSEDQIKDMTEFAALLKKMEGPDALSEEEIERFVALSSTYDADEARNFAAEQESAADSSAFLYSLLNDDETTEANQPGNDNSKIMPAGDGKSGFVSDDTLNKIGVTSDDVKAAEGYPWNALGNEPEDMTLKQFLEENIDSQGVEINGIKCIPHSDGALYSKDSNGNWQYKFTNPLSEDDLKILSQVPTDAAYKPFFNRVVELARQNNETSERLLMEGASNKGFISNMEVGLDGKVFIITNEDGVQLIAEEYGTSVTGKAMFRLLEDDGATPFKGEGEKGILFVVSKIGAKGLELEGCNENGFKIPTPDGKGFERLRIEDSETASDAKINAGALDSMPAAILAQAEKEQTIIHAGTTPDGKDRYKVFLADGSEIFAVKAGVNVQDPAQVVFKEINEDGTPKLDSDNKENLFVITGVAESSPLKSLAATAPFNMANGLRHDFDVPEEHKGPDEANMLAGEEEISDTTGLDTKSGKRSYMPKFMQKSKAAKWATIGVVAAGLTFGALFAAGAFNGGNHSSSSVKSGTKADSSYVQPGKTDTTHKSTVPGVVPGSGGKQDTTHKSTAPGIVPGNGGTQNGGKNKNPGTGGNVTAPITVLPGGRAMGSDTLKFNTDSTSIARTARSQGLWGLSAQGVSSYFDKYNVTDSTGKAVTFDSLKASGKHNIVIYNVVMHNTAENNLGKRGNGKSIEQYDLWNTSQLKGKPDVVFYEWDVKTALEKMGFKTVSVKPAQQTRAPAGQNQTKQQPSSTNNGTGTTVSGTSAVKKDTSTTVSKATAKDSSQVAREKIKNKIVSEVGKETESPKDTSKTAIPKDLSKTVAPKDSTDRLNPVDAAKFKGDKSAVDSLLKAIFLDDTDKVKQSPLDTLKLKSSGDSAAVKNKMGISSSVKRNIQSYSPLAENPAKASLAAYAALGLTSVVVAEREKKRRKKGDRRE